MATQHSEAAAATDFSRTGPIDVHSHVIPAFLVEALRDAREPLPGLMLPAARDWSASGTIAAMDRSGVAATVLSAIPLHAALRHMEAGDVAALVRRVNEFVTTLCHEHPGRFGLFAFLPMPDVELSLREIDYALDVLKANGIGLCTTYGDQSIADLAFVPVLAELDRRGAVVFCHPDLPDCCAKIDGAIGFPYDTGRAVFGLLLNGTLARFPNISWIFCHGGGTVPALAGRVREMTRAMPQLAQVAPHGIDHELRRLHYETGNAASSPTMAALLDYVPVSRVMFGTDAPYFGLDMNLATLRANRLDSEQLQAIERDNALRLIPGLA
jgi:predicted TIM-barrel fold metal-dependent hydrolase